MKAFLARHLHPITRKRLARFAEMRRAWWSFWILAGLYLISLGAEFVANDRPLAMRFEGRWFVPVLVSYSEGDLLGNGVGTRPDYKAILRSDRFKADPSNKAWLPLVPNGPREILKAEYIEVPEEVTATFLPDPLVVSVDLAPDGTIARTAGAVSLLGTNRAESLPLASRIELPKAVLDGIERRFRNEASDAVGGPSTGPGGEAVTVSLAAFSPRAQPPRTVRVSIRTDPGTERSALRVVVGPAGEVLRDRSGLWERLDDAQKAVVTDAAKRRFAGLVEPLFVEAGGTRLRVSFAREEVRFPFRPTEGHPFGIDNAGRDVLARIIYGFRTSMTFALLLVGVTMALGTMIGAAQGYFGGKVDLVGQRLSEIWETLPVLYIIMLLGSVFGRSFGLLLICFAVFNWIGISYYMRAEFLKLRRMPFVESAACLGLPHRTIMWRHIFPNALVPLVTFFPFSLVAAVGTLTALDFLGFGIPPPTPSWGELLAQAQDVNWAWWLTLYPSLALFAVMLMGTFIGEGVRAAFDPRRYSRLE